MRALFYVLLAACAAAQPPRLANAKLETRTDDFRALVSRTAGPAWIGYSVPANGDHQSCCWNDARCGCALEGGVASTASATGAPVKLEGGDLLVLFRVEQQAVGKIRTFSADCPLDAGGLPVYWLTNLRPEQSLALLEGFAGGADRLSDSAIAAIAFHAGAGADAVLEKLVAPGQPERVREKTVFWLGSARGRRGYELLQRIVHQDPSQKVREKAVFALSVSKEPAALDTLIETAHRDQDAHVRGQALFWLAQKAGKKAAAALTDAIENDPETEVKKRAVFALSQLPRDEGVPLLIQVARTNRNAAVRKQAIFWLGQSHDPRALGFFEDVLKK